MREENIRKIETRLSKILFDFNGEACEDIKSCELAINNIGSVVGDILFILKELNKEQK